MWYAKCISIKLLLIVFLRTKRKTAREASGTDFIALKKIPHTHTHKNNLSLLFLETDVKRLNIITGDVIIVYLP